MALALSLIVCSYLLIGAWIAKEGLAGAREDEDLDQVPPLVLILAMLAVVIAWPKILISKE